MPDGPPTIEITAVVTLDDQLRYAGWLLHQPAIRGERWLIQGAAILLTPPMSVLLGAVTLSLTGHKTFGMQLHGLLHDRETLLIMAEVAGLMVLYFALIRLLRRPLLRRRLRKLLIERPGVEASDPALGEPAWFRAGPDGFHCRTVTTTTTIGWAGIRRLADAGTIFVAETGRMSGYIIPKRCLLPDQATALGAVFRANGVASTPGP